MKPLFILLIMMTAVAYGQDERCSIGAHFGYSLSNSLYNGGETDLRSTFNAGIELRRKIGQKGLFLQSGLRWNEYGFRDFYVAYIGNEGYFNLVDTDYKSTSFFLSIPIIATYKLNKIVPGLTFSTGPQMSFYMFSKSNINGHINYFDSNYPILNLGLYFSTGYEHNIKEKWILGAEVYSNLNYPIGWYFGSDGDYNFGLAVSCRYILKQNE